MLVLGNHFVVGLLNRGAYKRRIPGDCNRLNLPYWRVVFKPRMFTDVFKSHTLLWISLKQLLDEILSQSIETGRPFDSVI